jgi:hypothetical protein
VLLGCLLVPAVLVDTRVASSGFSAGLDLVFCCLFLNRSGICKPRAV